MVRCEYAHGGLELPESSRKMGLGLDRVLDVFDYTGYSLADVKTRFGPQFSVLSDGKGGREEVLLGAPQADRLELRRVECKKSMSLEADGRFSILIMLEGAGMLRAGEHQLALKPWSRFFYQLVYRRLSYRAGRALHDVCRLSVLVGRQFNMSLVRVSKLFS